MSTININFKKVYSVGDSVSSYSSKISSNAANVSEVIIRVDREIKARRHIHQQLSSITSSLNKLQHDMSALAKLLKDSANNYEKAEEKLNKLAEKFERYPLEKYVKEQVGNIDHALKYFKTISHIPVGETGTILLTINKKGQVIAKYKGIKLDSNNKSSYLQIRDSLTKEFGGESGRYKKSFVTDLGKGIPLYEMKGSTKAKNFIDRFSINEFAQNTEKFTKLKNTPQYKKANNDIRFRFKNILKDESKNVLKDFKVWDGFSKIDKAGKLFGAAGTVFDFFENWNEASKEKNVFKKITKFVSGFAVDVGVGIGESALIVKGAAIGSAFAPPIGTVVGGALGFAVGFFCGEFVEDTLKGKNNGKIKEAVSSVSKVASKVGSKVASIGQSLNKILCW